jgi:predicted secreted protein
VNYWISQFFIYLIIWWVVLFAVLPWGIRPSEAPTEGHDPGAPLNPRLKAKALATTLVAAVVWGIYFVVTHYLGLSVMELGRS